MKKSLSRGIKLHQRYTRSAKDAINGFRRGDKGDEGVTRTAHIRDCNGKRNRPGVLPRAPGKETTPMVGASNLTTLTGEVSLRTSKGSILIAICEVTLVLHGIVSPPIRARKRRMTNSTWTGHNIQKRQPETISRIDTHQIRKPFRGGSL